MEKKEGQLTRRDFLVSTAFLGGVGFAFSQMGWAFSQLTGTGAPVPAGKYLYELQMPENIICTACLQCHNGCSLKAKLVDGVLVKIDGSPYGPQTMLPHIPYKTSPQEAVGIDGRICAKGQAGIQTLYDPYRLIKVLKRAGPRGSNKWKVVSFQQAIDEIVQGGQLFKESGENRTIAGLKDLFVLKDPSAGKALAEDVEKVKKKEMTVAQFKAKHQANLGLLIDPDHPDLGPKNNQFVILNGRIQHGRSELSKRFVNDAFGSVNWFEHTSICEQSHHIAFKEMTNQYDKGKWAGGKSQLKPDLLNAQFVIFWGTGAFEANFGKTAMAEQVTHSLINRNMKMAVIDPRLSRTAGKANMWIPIKPGTDSALAMAMIRWMIETEHYDKTFLENANKAAAKADGEPSWTNASYLVKIEEGQPTKLLRASEVGLGSEHQFVVMRQGRARPVEPGDEKLPVEGDLFFSGQVGQVKVKSALELLKEQAFSRSLEEWAGVCAVPKATIMALCRELTSHGKKVAIDSYRGPAQHTNGYYAIQAITSLALLAGCPDWKGGLSVGSGHWHELGDKEGQPFNLKEMHPGKLKAFGIKLTREGSKYEESTLFSGHPAKRPWYPLTAQVFQEVLPAAEATYPYPIKAMLMHMGTAAYSCPGGHRYVEILKNLDKIPLLIACDIVVGDTSMYADYVFPDITYLERWGTPHIPPSCNPKGSLFRQPVVAPLTDTVEVDGQVMPMSLEALFVALAKKLGLSGFGKDGFVKGLNLDRPEDWYLKLAANIAWGDKPGDELPDASKEEWELFIKARRHLPKSVFDPQVWMNAVGDKLWPKVIYMLNRGGRYQPLEKAYDGDYMGPKVAGMFNIYCENVAKVKDSMTGRPYSGIAIYEPAKNSNGSLLAKEDGTFDLITFKEVFGTQSRTISNYWCNLSLMPENLIWMNSRDAQRLALRDGSTIKLISRTNPEGLWNLGNGLKKWVAGKVKVTEGIMPGVLAVSTHYGHWGYGAADLIVDGQLVKGDPRRGTGLNVNAVMFLDDYLKNVCLTDPIGGSASYYDSKVKLVPNWS